MDKPPLSRSLISANARGDATIPRLRAQLEHDDSGQLHINELQQGKLDEMNKRANVRALQCRRCDAENAAFKKEISAQNCADVLKRALAPNVFRRLSSDHVPVGFATA